MILKINSFKNLKRIPRLFITSKFVNLGYIPDKPSSKDYLFKDSVMYSAPIVEYVSLKRYFKEISDQGSLSSCVGNAVADSCEAMQIKRSGLDPSKVDNLSRLFIYWNARNLDTPPSVNSDSGSNIRFAFDSIRRYGVPPEHIYPYLSYKVNDRPGWIAYKYAIQNKITAFYRIDATGDERIEQIIKALSAGNPVVFGTSIYESFRHVTNNTIIKLNTNDKYLGGHALILTGWDNTKQAFELRNSWSKSWGTNGYGYIDVNYIKNSASRDFWVCTI